MNNDGFICYCDNTTEKECLQLMLFGYKAPVHQIVEASTQFTTGFLYNYRNDELIGHFKAITPFRLNIEPNAFGGRYPFQIRVSPVGTLLRKSRAIHFFKEIKICVGTSQYGNHLPFPVITSVQVEKLIHCLHTLPLSALDKIIDELIQTIPEPELKLPLEALRKKLKLSELTDAEADENLIFLREQVIKKDIPGIPANLGVLRKSFKHHLLAEKITNQSDFDDLCTSPSLKYDPGQNKYLPLIFEIIKMIRLR